MRKVKAKYKYGWKPDLPDHRDRVYSLIFRGELPPFVDLTPSCPAVYNQGDLGSCTANAISAAYQFDQLKEQKEPFCPSRLFIYFNERVMENSIQSDSGAQIRDGIKSVAAQGVCEERIWPYIPERFNQRPPTLCYTQAISHRAISYQSIAQTLEAFKICLASGYPFVFGFSVFESFEGDKTASTGLVDMPGPNESILGGHAVMAVGYDDAQKHVIVRNSWGDLWGDKGNFYLPYSYIGNQNLASDFWQIRTVL